MRPLIVSVSIASPDGKWRADWSASTSRDPHRVTSLAKLIAGVAGPAAAGDWEGEQVGAVLAQIGRDHPDLEPAAVSWPRGQEEPVTLVRQEDQVFKTTDATDETKETV